MQQVKWFEREFNFQSTQNTFPSIIERLAGTAARLEEKFRNIPVELTDIRINGSWSIKENVGHLTDLEPLWQGRLDDILKGETELRATDLLNNRTTEANHNAVSIESLLSSFRQIRNDTVARIKKLDEMEIFMSSLHPRLKTPMRVIDHFLFVAEHDDHHLVRITELVNLAEK